MSFVRRTSSDTAGTGTTVTYGQATQAGNLLVVAMMTSGNNTAAVTATGWSIVQAALDLTADTCVVAYKISTGETSSPAFAQTGIGTPQWLAFEYSGSANPAVKETNNSSTTGSTLTLKTLATGAITTTNAADLIFHMCGFTNTDGFSTSWTTATNILANTETKVMAGQYLPAANLTSFTDAANWTTARGATTITVAFEDNPSPSITPVVGSYSISGKTTPLAYGHIVSPISGSYSISGQAAPFIYGHVLAPVKGSYAISGITTPLVFGHKISPVAGNYSISGQVQYLQAGRSISPAAGSYAISGIGMPFSFGHVIAPAVGSYSITGNPATMTHGGGGNTNITDFINTFRRRRR